jgi:hypothetical protein
LPLDSDSRRSASPCSGCASEGPGGRAGPDRKEGSSGYRTGHRHRPSLPPMRGAARIARSPWKVQSTGTVGRRSVC